MYLAIKKRTILASILLLIIWTIPAVTKVLHTDCHQEGPELTQKRSFKSEHGDLPCELCDFATFPSQLTLPNYSLEPRDYVMTTAVDTYTNTQWDHFSNEYKSLRAPPRI